MDISVCVMDGNDPLEVIKHGKTPILHPEEMYETSGFFGNVVFSNGVIRRDDDKIMIYYGACDETVCMAEASIQELLKSLE